MRPVLRDALLLAALATLAGCTDSEPTAATQAEATDAAAPAASPEATRVASTPEPQAAPVPGHLRQGQQLFQYWCAACHGRGPGHPGTQALAARYGGTLPEALEDRTDLTPEFVAYFVRNGISVMPFFRKTEIDDEQLARIGAYLSRQPAPTPPGGQP